MTVGRDASSPAAVVPRPSVMDNGVKRGKGERCGALSITNVLELLSTLRSALQPLAIP